VKTSAEFEAFNAAMDTILMAASAKVKAEMEQDKQQRAERRIILRSGRESSRLRIINRVTEKQCNSGSNYQNFPAGVTSTMFASLRSRQADKGVTSMSLASRYPSFPD
jgi:hypothetical protein